MASSEKQALQKTDNSISKTLSRNIAEHLLDLMRAVTKEEINPKTVSAACNCANQLYKIMTLNLKIRKDFGE
jgi:hypothetical protein